MERDLTAIPGAQSQSQDSALRNDMPFDPVEVHRIIVNRENARKYLPEPPQTKSAENQTKPPEAPKTSAAAAGNHTNPRPRTFTVTSRVLTLETDAQTNHL